MRYKFILFVWLCLLTGQLCCHAAASGDTIPVQQVPRLQPLAGTKLKDINKWAIGLRVGDPTGISLKRYFGNGNNALEINVGRTHIWGWKKYYNKRHLGVFVSDRQYKEVFPASLQIRYVLQRAIPKTVGWHWYGGVGGQFRYNNYSIVSVNEDDKEVVEQRFKDVDLGADFVAGLEYKVPKSPFSVFMDATIFLEIVDNPFLAWTQGGLGVRYHLGQKKQNQ